jgi:hypothetical protein
MRRIAPLFVCVDEFGRIKGSFRYEYFWLAAAPRLGGSTLLELTYLIKES